MSEAPQIGQTIGQYTLEERIGSGGMATVYRAQQAKLGRDVAVKVMHQTFTADSAFLARFEREARIVARLDHANIVPIYDYDHVGGTPYLVMKYIPGKTLKRRLTDDGPLPLDDIMRIVPPIAHALTYAHRQGILHRDVKTSNIILDERGTPYLMDFGLARIAQTGESSLSAEMLIGTPHYISPEQAQGASSIDGRADVYSLGVVLYELVVGRVPFTGESPYIIVHKHIYTEPTPPSAVDPEIPPAVDAVILKALAKNPADRYQTPDELAAAFEAAVKQSGLSSLDASRAIRAEQMRAENPSPIPQALRDSGARKPSGGAPLTASGMIDEVINRVRDTVSEVRETITQPGFMDQISERAREVVVDVQTGARSRRPDGIRPETIRRAGPRANRAIERDWSMEESAVRARIRKRRELRGGLIGNAIAWLIVSVIAFAAFPTGLLGFLRTVVDNPEDMRILEIMMPLIPYFISMPWLGAVIANTIDTFSQTGHRQEARRDRIYDEMTALYGPDWVDTADDRQYKAVRHSVNERFNRPFEFFKVTAILGTLATMFFMVWPGIMQVIETASNDPIAMQLIPNVPALLLAIFMIPISITGVQALASRFGAGDERAVQRELERMRRASGKVKNEDKQKLDDADVRLTGDGEFTDSFIEELDDRRGMEQRRRR